MEVIISVLGLLLFALYVQVDILTRLINRMNRKLKNERNPNDKEN
jgi:hypothetical protein